MEPSSADALLTTTRTIRRRLDLTTPVSLDLVKDCLRVALQAPNGGDSQRWRWIVVADPGQRKLIAGWYRKAWYDRYSSLVGDASNRLVSSAAHLADHLDQVPVLVIPCLELDRAALPEGNQASLWGSLLPACWSYMLAARARNLGTAWTTVHLAYEQQVAEVLKLPATVRQGALIPTAHILGEGFRPAGRRPLDEVMYVDRWAAA